MATEAITLAGEPFDMVVKIAGGWWPGRSRPDGTLVDLRTFAPNPEVANQEILGWHPEKLAKPWARIPTELIDLAATSIPPGFILVSRGE